MNDGWESLSRSHLALWKFEHLSDTNVTAVDNNIFKSILLNLVGLYSGTTFEHHQISNFLLQENKMYFLFSQLYKRYGNTVPSGGLGM